MRVYTQVALCVLVGSVASAPMSNNDADGQASWLEGLRESVGASATIPASSATRATSPVEMSWLDKMKESIRSNLPLEEIEAVPVPVPPPLPPPPPPPPPLPPAPASVPLSRANPPAHLPAHVSSKGKVIVEGSKAARAMPSSTRLKVQPGAHQYNRSSSSSSSSSGDSWSWHDAQREFAECSPEMPGPRLDKYMVWVSTSALGNGLNIFAHAFVFALVSGRQLVVGPGTVPSLLCGPKGAFHCGIPTVEEVWGTEKNYKKKMPQMQYRWNRDSAKDDKPVWESAVKWYQYGGVSHVL